jgi:hypothetical protein
MWVLEFDGIILGPNELPIFENTFTCLALKMSDLAQAFFLRDGK